MVKNLISTKHLKGLFHFKEDLIFLGKASIGIKNNLQKKKEYSMQENKYLKKIQHFKNTWYKC